MDLDINYIDNNESSFCLLWSRTHKKIDCIELFRNPNLGEDYFFNRLNINNNCSSNINDILKTIKDNFSHDLKRYYIHTIYHNKNKNINANTVTKIKELHLPKFGIMKILSLGIDQLVTKSSKHIEVKVVDKDYLNLWIDVFCRSFDWLEKRDEITNIISQYFKKFTLLMAYYKTDEIKYPAGCCLLFEKDEIISLYCLGTIYQFRKKGVARELIINALKISKNKDYHSLILQTLTKEGFEDFYYRLGFKAIYKKVLYTFSID